MLYWAVYYPCKTGSCLNHSKKSNSTVFSALFLYENPKTPNRPVFSMRALRPPHTWPPSTNTHDKIQNCMGVKQGVPKLVSPKIVQTLLSLRHQVELGSRWTAQFEGACVGMVSGLGKEIIYISIPYNSYGYCKKHHHHRAFRTPSRCFGSPHVHK